MPSTSTMLVHDTGPAFALRRISTNLLILLALFPVRFGLTALVVRTVSRYLFGSILVAQFRQLHWYEGFWQSWYVAGVPMLFIGVLQQIALYLILCFIPASWSPSRRRAIAVLSAPLALWPFQWPWMQIPQVFAARLGVTGTEYVFLNAIQFLPVISVALLYGFLTRLPVELPFDAIQQGVPGKVDVENVPVGNERRHACAKRGLVIGVLAGIGITVGLLLSAAHSSDPEGALLLLSLLGMPVNFIVGNLMRLVYRIGYMSADAAPIISNIIVMYVGVPLTGGALGALIGGARDRSR